jgi:hypothetical protein
MMMSPGKAAPAARRAEAQALVTFVPCGPNRGLAGLQIVGQPGLSGGEYFLPFGTGESGTASDRALAYGGILAAIDRLRDMKIARVLIIVDDEQLVAELERRAEPAREVFLQYVIVGCKLNEFRRVKVVAAQSSRIEQLRTKTANLAATIYNTPLPLAHAI